MDVRTYISKVVHEVGSDLSVGRYLGLADGSRVGMWRKGRGRPSELMCVKLARWRGDDPIEILRVAGYDELADLLSGQLPDVSARNVHKVELLQSQLNTLRSMIDSALAQTRIMGGDSEKADRH